MPKKQIIFFLVFILFSVYVYACIDSDGGIAIQSGGILYSSVAGMKVDRCVSDTEVMEFWCVTFKDGIDFNYQTIKCPTGMLCLGNVGECGDALAECVDSKDNDLDNLTDSEDLGCINPDDNSENNPKCVDSKDNDLDSLFDYPKDRGCSSNNDNDESDNLKQPGKRCILDPDCYYDNCLNLICGNKDAACLKDLNGNIVFPDSDLSISLAEIASGILSYENVACASNVCSPETLRCEGYPSGHGCIHDTECESGECTGYVCEGVGLPTLGESCVDSCIEPYICSNGICGGEGADCKNVDVGDNSLCVSNLCEETKGVFKCSVSGCVDDSSCDLNQRCESNACEDTTRTEDCSNNLDDDSDKFTDCDDSECKFVSVCDQSTKCDLDNDCDPGLICEGSNCGGGNGVGATCTDNSQCITNSCSGSAGRAGVCLCAVNNDCISGETCQDGRCVTECVLDSDCSPEYCTSIGCDPLSGQELCSNNLDDDSDQLTDCGDDDCSNNLYCGSGQCIVDTDCDPNKRCDDSGACVSVQSCDSNNECSGMVCFNHGCELKDNIPNLIVGSNVIDYDCDDLGGVYCNTECSSGNQDLFENYVVPLESQANGFCCVVDLDLSDSTKFPSGECSYEMYSPTAGNLLSCTTGPCNDPDGDGVGDRTVNCGNLEITEVCVYVPNSAREVQADFYDSISLIISFSLLIGFYIKKRKT